MYVCMYVSYRFLIYSYSVMVFWTLGHVCMQVCMYMHLYAEKAWLRVTSGFRAEAGGQGGHWGYLGAVFWQAWMVWCSIVWYVSGMV